MTVELKSRAFVETNKLGEHFVLNDANTFDAISKDLYTTCVLEPAGITLDQLKKKDKLEAEYLQGSVLVGGEVVADRMRTNSELHEVSLSIPMGGTRTASAVFTRGQATVVALNTKVETAEMKRVLVHLDGLFNDVSS